MQEDRNYLRNRINRIYRNHLILNYYSSKLLKDSLPTEENLKKVEDLKAKITVDSYNPVQEIARVASINPQLKDYIDPLKICADMLNSEFFFDVRSIVESILSVYEKSMSKLIEDCRISPFDQMKVNRIDFV